MESTAEHFESLDLQGLRSLVQKLLSELEEKDQELKLKSKELESSVQELQSKDEELKFSEKEIRVLKLEIKLMCMKLLRINVERRPDPDPGTIDLFTGEAPQTQELVSEAKSPTPAKRKPRKPEENRQPLPEELERKVTVLDIPDKDKVCPQTGKPLRCLGVVVSESLEIEPPRFYVRRIERPQYVCVDHPEEGVLTMTLPRRIIDKGLAGESLLAFILTSKFVDHLPLERITKMLSRSGVTLSRQTLSDWVLACGEVLEPMRAALKAKILNARIVNADETTYKVIQNRMKGKPISGYLWGFIGDRRWLLFEWNDGRSGTHPKAFLEKARCEYLQTDAYSGYNEVLRAHPALHAVGCWAHVRRKFAESEKIGEAEASPYLDLIAKLYQVESQAKQSDASGEEHVALRQTESKAILAELKGKANADQCRVIPKSPLGKSIAYMQNHWDALQTYLKDGDVEIDNNIIERAIRPVALGRKNWLFSGSEPGAQTAALVISLVGCCALSKVDPAKYLRNLLRLLPNVEKGGDYDNLLPDALKPILDDLDKTP